MHGFMMSPLYSPLTDESRQLMLQNMQNMEQLIENIMPSYDFAAIEDAPNRLPYALHGMFVLIGVLGVVLGEEVMIQGIAALLAMATIGHAIYSEYTKRNAHAFYDAKEQEQSQLQLLYDLMCLIGQPTLSAEEFYTIAQRNGVADAEIDDIIYGNYRHDNDDIFIQDYDPEHLDDSLIDATHERRSIRRGE